MSERNKKRILYWVLQMCISHDKTSLSVDDLYKKRSPELEVDFGDINLAIKELEKKELIIGENRHGWAEEIYFYRATKKGKRVMARAPYSEQMRALSFLPPEYGLDYRMKNIEYLVFNLFFLIVSSIVLAFFFQLDQIWLTLITILIIYFFFLFITIHTVRIVVFVLNREANRFLGKTHNLLDKYPFQISNVIVAVIVVLALVLPFLASWKAFVVALAGLLAAAVFRNSEALRFRNWLTKKLKTIKKSSK